MTTFEPLVTPTLLVLSIAWERLMYRLFTYRYRVTAKGRLELLSKLVFIYMSHGIDVMSENSFQ